MSGRLGEDQPAVTELKESDIKIINLDTQVQNREDVDAYIGSDNTSAGVICGEKLIEAAPDGGQVVIWSAQHRIQLLTG